MIVMQLRLEMINIHDGSPDWASARQLTNASTIYAISLMAIISLFGQIKGPLTRATTGHPGSYASDQSCVAQLSATH
jgi:hypothetical protein